MSVVAIHQPNFFPWLGYFDKIVRSDRFVFLDDVQIQKTGGGWANRVKILIAGVPKWVTAPIDRNYHGGRKISETRFASNTSWRTSIFRTIQVHYKNAPYYGYGCELIESLLMNPEENLAAYNTSVILSIADELGISRSKFRWSSRLDHSGQSNELLVSIVKNVGGNAYMCGGGADGYQDQSFFDAASIHLINQNYKTAYYPQFGGSEFVPGLSIIDAFMNLGGEGTRHLLFNFSSSQNGL
jgi:hypothetical protein